MTEATKKPLSTAGLIRVNIENSMELRNGKRGLRLPSPNAWLPCR